MSLVLGSIILVLNIFILSGVGIAAEKPILMKIGHIDGPEIYISKKHTAAVAFKSYVESKSGGRIKVEIYPAFQLGSEREQFEAIQANMIQGTLITEGTTALFFPPIQVITIPYLFKDATVAWEFFDGWFGDKLKESLLKQCNVRLIAVGEDGLYDWTNSKHPIRTLEDFKGLLIRTMEVPAHMNMVETLGAHPTALSWADVYTAMQTGVVDGQMNSSATIALARFWEVQKYLTDDDHLYGADLFMISENWFKSLPDDLKDIILTGGKVAGVVSRGVNQIRDVLGLQEIEENGMEVYSPSTEERNRWKDISRKPVIDWLKTQIDPQWVEDALKAVKEIEANK